MIGPLCEAVNSRRLGDAFVVPANSALRLRSLALTVWSCGPTNGNDEIRRRCARRVVPTCPRRHTLLSGHKKTPQRFSNFGQSSQNANSLLKRLLGPRAVHVSVSKEESTRSLRIVCRFRLEQQASCTFACCATQSKLSDRDATTGELIHSVEMPGAPETVPSYGMLPIADLLAKLQSSPTGYSLVEFKGSKLRRLGPTIVLLPGLAGRSTFIDHLAFGVEIDGWALCWRQCFHRNQQRPVGQLDVQCLVGRR